MSYDSRCWDLAEAFLESEPSLNNDFHRDALAQMIQGTIEDYIEWNKNEIGDALEEANEEIERRQFGPIAQSVVDKAAKQEKKDE